MLIVVLPHPMLTVSPEIMTGADLHRLLLAKWGKSYDLRIQRRRQRVLLMVMWRYQEQQSFPMSQADYLDHLDAIAEQLCEWGVAEAISAELRATPQRPRLGKAIAIPVDLGVRASEWLL
ncbi:MAG: DUF3067 family protein [Cyanobacteria bacterium J06648_11]